MQLEINLVEEKEIIHHKEMDEDMMTNEDIISGVNNRRINELTTDEDLIMEWIDMTEARISYRDFVVQKFGKALIKGSHASES